MAKGSSWHAYFGFVVAFIVTIAHVLETDTSYATNGCVLGINYPNTRFVDLIPTTLAQAGYESENLARSI